MLCKRFKYLKFKGGRSFECGRLFKGGRLFEGCTYSKHYGILSSIDTRGIHLLFTHMILWLTGKTKKFSLDLRIVYLKLHNSFIAHLKNVRNDM